MLPKIVPTVLVKNKPQLRERLKVLTGLVARVQIDIIDGVFAKEQTILPEDLSGEDINFELDFHLMVDQPGNWIDRCLKVGADRITAQVERMESQAEFVGKLKPTGKEIGLALDLNTKLERLNFQLLESLDAVLLMSVEAGQGGQKLDRRVVSKIKKLAKIRDRLNLDFKIQVDGGIKKENAFLLVQAGAQELAVGSAISNKNPSQSIQEFKKVLTELKES